MLTTTDFVQPCTQENLGGEVGLTSEDIARSLGVNHYEITRKIKKLPIDQLIKLGFNIQEVSCKSQGPGRPRILFYLNTNASKFVVAKYDNEQGWGYMACLIQSDAIVQEVVPKLLARIKDLEAQLARAYGPMVKTIKGKRHLVLTELVSDKDMFGTDEYNWVVAEKKPIDGMSKPDVKKYKLQHSTKVMAGIMRMFNEIHDSFPEPDPAIKALADVIGLQVTQLNDLVNHKDVLRIGKTVLSLVASAPAL